MTRKDYVKFAAMLKDERAVFAKQDNESFQRDRHDLLDILAFRMTTIFAADNPDFDRAWFLDACGVES